MTIEELILKGRELKSTIYLFDEHIGYEFYKSNSRKRRLYRALRA